MTTTIIVGVDGSSSATHALRWAVREAELHQWAVKAVLAWSLVDQTTVDPDASFDPDYGPDDARRALDHFLEEALGDDATSVETLVVCDLPAPALLDATGPEDLLVVGARGLGGVKGLLLGSVSQKCLHHGTRTVAVVHEPASEVPDRPVERIVVGIDGSDAASGALRWAVEEARVRGAQLEVVHAWHLPYVSGPAYGIVDIDPTPFGEAAERTAADAIEGIDTEGLDHPVQSTVTSDGAASAILAAARGADLVVVGTRGTGGFKGLLLGSVSQQIASHAPCPVVLVPPR